MIAKCKLCPTCIGSHLCLGPCLRTRPIQQSLNPVNALPLFPSRKKEQPELSVSQPCGMHMVWCATIKTYSCPTRREGLGAELSRDNVCQGSSPEAEASRGSTAARDRFWVCWALEEWEDGPGRGGRACVGGGKRCDGTEEERGNLRDMGKKATKDKRINQSINLINYQTRQVMRQQTPNEFINHSPNRKRMAFDPNRMNHLRSSIHRGAKATELSLARYRLQQHQ